jgi:hypothetical protein
MNQRVRDENEFGRAAGRCRASAGRVATGHVRGALSSAAGVGGASMLIIVLKIFAMWTACSVATGLAIAPALARRLRDINFRPKDE